LNDRDAPASFARVASGRPTVSNGGKEVFYDTLMGGRIADNW
jgi:hypothetical protein